MLCGSGTESLLFAACAQKNEDWGASAHWLAVTAGIRGSRLMSEKASAGPIADIVGKIALLTNRAADFFCALAPRTWTWQPERL
mmetsp:Transcript_27589/g.43085  ORF Transcript_27589/g.43085 Transcript_27589/m.43085 type:complete len:84 (+) Transcript_27589:498-749(+)